MTTTCFCLAGPRLGLLTTPPEQSELMLGHPSPSSKSQGREGGGLAVRQEPALRLWVGLQCQAGSISGSPGAGGSIWTQQAHWAGFPEEAAPEGKQA